MNHRELTCTSERRIVPKFVIKGGIARVTRFSRGRGGVRVHYVYEGGDQTKKGEGWVLLSEWAKYRRCHRPRPVSLASYFKGVSGVTVKGI